MSRTKDAKISFDKKPPQGGDLCELSALGAINFLNSICETISWLVSTRKWKGSVGRKAEQLKEAKMKSAGFALSVIVLAVLCAPMAWAQENSAR